MNHPTTQPQLPMADENTVLERIQADVGVCLERELWSNKQANLIPKWEQQVSREPGRFLGKDGTIDVDALRNFRRLQIFVPDTPAWNPDRFDPRNLLGGGRRGDRKMVGEALDLVRSSHAEPLLRKYPCPSIGNPCVFRAAGYAYTYRWLKHVSFLGLTQRVLGEKLADDFVAMDIGSSYGIFSGFLKHEWNRSTHVLVDFPEQLFLAHYFLANWHPGCRIAGIGEVLEQKTLTREWLKGFDFVLLPCPEYSRMGTDAVDLVSNFASLGEMSREWFATYMTSPAVRTSQYLFLVNRIQSAPTYDTDLTVLDYPLWQPFQKLHFGISPVFSFPYIYPRRLGLFTGKLSNNPYFEYIGERVDG